MYKHEVNREEAHNAAETLRDPKASKAQKSQAGSELSEARQQKRHRTTK